MFEHVAVIQIPSGIAVETHDNGEHFPWIHHRRVLPSRFIRRRFPRPSDELDFVFAQSYWIVTLPLEDLKLHQMQMHGVRIIRVVNESPLFGGSQLYALAEQVLVAFAIDANSEGSPRLIEGFLKYRISGRKIGRVA